VWSSLAACNRGRWPPSRRLRELIAAASRQPGHLSTEVLRGSSARSGREYHIVYRFADEQSLRAWHASPVRRALVVALTR
jgi:antibiotic biosynthesis monooxygenase (ABM) superfamily enzyme